MWVEVSWGDQIWIYQRKEQAFNGIEFFLLEKRT